MFWGEKKKGLTSSGCPQPVLAISEFSSNNRGTHAGGPQGNLTSGLLSPPLSRKVIYSEKHHLSSVWSALLTLAECLSSPQRYPHLLPTTIVEKKRIIFLRLWPMYNSCFPVLFQQEMRLYFCSPSWMFELHSVEQCLQSLTRLGWFHIYWKQCEFSVCWF